MPIVTLTTDFGLKDHYVGAFKGKLLSNISNITLVDISHTVANYNIFEAWYVVEHAYNHFPKGTYHVVAVDAECTPWQPVVVAMWNGHYFIGVDNGIFSLLFAHSTAVVVAIDNIENVSETTIFTNVIQQLNHGVTLEKLGKPFILKPIYQLANEPSEANVIKGRIVYIDGYGNCISNINKSTFLKTNTTNYEIRCKNKSLGKISRFYSDFKFNDMYDLKNYEGKLICLFNDEGWLQFSIYKGSTLYGGTAETLLGIRTLDTVTIILN